MHIKLTNDGPEIYTIGQLRRDNPNVSLPRRVSADTLASYGVYPYTMQDQPEYDPVTQVIEPGDFAETESGWVRGWTVRDKTVEELAVVYEQHAASAKAECRRRILAVANETTQSNIAQAGVIYAAMRLNGVPEAAAMATVRFEPGDLTAAADFQAWRAAMVTVCRQLIEDISADYTDDGLWPTAPESVVSLAARF